MPMVRRHILVSTHSRLKAAGLAFGLFGKRWNVSTHSRLKAAGMDLTAMFHGRQSFNTQPPEGGWLIELRHLRDGVLFQHTAARRRLGPVYARTCRLPYVSTHSRPKAAGLTQEIRRRP